jgi:hypothetical protein
MLKLEVRQQSQLNVKNTNVEIKSRTRIIIKREEYISGSQLNVNSALMLTLKVRWGSHIDVKNASVLTSKVGQGKVQQVFTLSLAIPIYCPSCKEECKASGLSKISACFNSS